MIAVSVYDQPIRRLTGVGKTSGKPYDMSIQTAYAHVVDSSGKPLPVPEKFEIVLEKDQQPYAPGQYQLSPDSLYVDRNGRFGVSPKLVPLKRG